MVDIGVVLLSQVVLFYGVKYILREMDPLRKKKDEAKGKLNKLNLRKDLDEYEQIIASEIIDPADIKTSFADIGGMAQIIEDLRTSVIYPLNLPVVNDLIAPPRGCLFHGSSGVGKTLLAKALCKESGATFINLHVSTLTEKWFGESQKLVKAVFTLARKVQPSIVFIDEIDAFLRTRSQQDHEVSAAMKSEFLTLWDGLGSDNDRIIILGATNREHDIDSAFMRRLPKKFYIPMPGEQERLQILKVILRQVEVSVDVLKVVAKETKNYSGSDLKELCRDVVLVPMKESMEQKLDQVRPLTMNDFLRHLRGIQAETID